MTYTIKCGFLFFKNWEGSEPKFTASENEAFVSFNRVTVRNLIDQIRGYYSHYTNKSVKLEIETK